MSARWFHAQGGFFSLPRAIRYDDRLSHPDLRVLVAVASFVFLKDEVFPGRESLQRITGIDATNISKRTKRLVGFGWLEKSGLPGKNITYRLMVPSYALNRMNEKNTRGKTSPPGKVRECSEMVKAHIELSSNQKNEAQNDDYLDGEMEDWDDF